MTTEHEWKKCGHCQITWPISEFNRNRARSDGHNSQCRACRGEYRAQNRDHIRAYAYLHLKDREKAAAANKAWYIKNCSAGSTCQAQKALLKRCTDPNHKSFKRYGARLQPCFPESWRDINAMIADVGERPSPAHTLHRPCVDRGYAADNAVWSLSHAEPCPKGA